jgi:hypothetical protein
MLGVEMRGLVLLVIHPDNDAEEGRDDRHVKDSQVDVGPRHDGCQWFAAVALMRRPPARAPQVVEGLLGGG